MQLTELTTVTAAELALSVDNVMVWALIIKQTGLPKRLERRAVLAGVGIAFAVRFVAIELGAAALERFAWLHYALAGLLILTGVKITRSIGHGDSDDVPSWVSRIGSPTAAAIIGLGLTDILFAIDSIPASFAVTSDPTTIVVGNAVALAALWSLYSVVSRLIDRFAYLTHGLAAIMFYLGVSMLTDVPSAANLAVIASIITGSVVVSRVKSSA